MRPHRNGRMCKVFGPVNTVERVMPVLSTENIADDLERTASREPARGGGAAALHAAQGAQGAALIAMVARYSLRGEDIEPETARCVRLGCSRWSHRARIRGQSVGRRSKLRSSWALSATMMVDRLIRTAPTAGARTNPMGARIPAASGTAAML